MKTSSLDCKVPSSPWRIRTEEPYFIVIADFQKNEVKSSIEAGIIRANSVHVTEQIAFHVCCTFCYDFTFLRHSFSPVLNMKKKKESKNDKLCIFAEKQMYELINDL